MTSLTPAQKERQRSARARAGQIRFGMQSYIETLGVIAQARAEADHLTLGYETWQEYVDGEFGDARIKLPPEMRRKAVEELRLSGASQREIAHTLGVSPGTVNSDLARVQDRTPAEKSPLVEAVRQSLVDADERTQNPAVAAADGADGSGGTSAPPNPGVAAPEPDEQASQPSSGTAPEGGLTQPPSGAPPDHPGAPANEVPGEDAESPDASSEADGLLGLTSAAGEPGLKPGSPAPDPSHAQGFSGEETGTPGSAPGTPEDQRPRGEAGSSAVTGEPAPDPIGTVLDALDEMAAETGICPACRRPLG